MNIFKKALTWIEYSLLESMGEINSSWRKYKIENLDETYKIKVPCCSCDNGTMVMDVYGEGDYDDVIKDINEFSKKIEAECELCKEWRKKQILTLMNRTMCCPHCETESKINDIIKPFYCPECNKSFFFRKDDGCLVLPGFLHASARQIARILNERRQRTKDKEE